MQHDYDLANQAGAAFRSDLNDVLAAIVGLNSGTGAPSATFGNMLWIDTTANLAKKRNNANGAWQTFASKDFDLWLLGDGAVGGPAYSFSADPDTGFYRIGANNVGAAAGGALIWQWSATGLGVFTAPSYALHVEKSSSGADVVAKLANSSNTSTSNAVAWIQTAGSSANDPFILFDCTATQWSVGIDNSDSDKFKVSKNTSLGTNDYLAIDTSGNVAITTLNLNGGTNGRILSVATAGATPAAIITGDTATTALAEFWNKAAAGDNILHQFFTEASITARGSIVYNRAGGVVAYQTTSDYRAKDLFGTFENAGELIDAVPVHLGMMKGATEKRPMFIAHELQEFAPWAVTGDKDGVREIEIKDEEGNVTGSESVPVMQQVDHQVLIPALWAEVKALRARLAALEAAP